MGLQTAGLVLLVLPLVVVEEDGAGAAIAAEGGAGILGLDLGLGVP